MTGEMNGKLVVVTGASSGVGAACARHLASAGADLILVGRRAEALDSVAAEARRLGVEATCLVGDLADLHDTTSIADTLAAGTRGIDVLVHAAGKFLMQPVAEADAAGFDAVLAVNVRAPMLLTRATLPKLREAAGHVVFVNSSSGHTAKATTSAYDASKHALTALADSLRAELNDEGIRVLSLFLGRTATPMQAQIHAAAGRPYHPERLLQAEDVARVLLPVLLLPRTAEVTDLHIRPMLKG